jgi:hypothetical protein
LSFVGADTNRLRLWCPVPTKDKTTNLSASEIQSTKGKLERGGLKSICF